MIRLAVVEDQTLTRETTVERLAAWFGMDVPVLGYANVEQMLAAGLDFDVVVLDLHLRGGGAENAEAVRLVARSSKVVVLSGHESAEAVQRAVAAGALGYVSKESTDSIGTLAEAKQIIEAWRQEYNESRPHRAHGERTPHEIAKEFAASREFLDTQTAGDSLCA